MTKIKFCGLRTLEDIDKALITIALCREIVCVDSENAQYSLVIMSSLLLMK